MYFLTYLGKFYVKQYSVLAYIWELQNIFNIFSYSYYVGELSSSLYKKIILTFIYYHLKVNIFIN